jgi:predicted dehydrogenase
VDRSDFRYDPALGGGALLDLGCYPVHWARHLAGAEPVVARAAAVLDPLGVEVQVSAELRFPGEVVAEVHASMQPRTPFRAWLCVRGDEGELLVENPLAPHHGHAVEVRGRSGCRSEQVAGRTTYEHQLEAFAAAVLDGAPSLTAGDESIANLRALDSIRRAAGLCPHGEA